MSSKPMESALVVNRGLMEKAGVRSASERINAAKDTEAMPTGRVTDDDERATRIAMMQAMTMMATKEQPRGGVRTEVIGIFVLLLGMIVQTGAGFYWAGQQSRQSESQAAATKELKDTVTYIQAQLQVIDGTQKKQEGRLEAEEKRKGNR